MDHQTYRIIHIVGLLLLFFGLGGVLLAPLDKRPKLASILHGLGLLVILFGGFGIHAKKAFSWDAWLFVKIGAWLVVAMLPLLVKKSIVPHFLAWVVALAAGGLAAWLGLAVVKPF